MNMSERASGNWTLSNRWSMPDLSFYVVAPLAIAVLLGWHHAGLGRLLSSPTSVMLWTLTIGSWWIIAEVFMRIARRLPMRLSCTAQVILAAAAALALSPFYGSVINAFATAVDGVAFVNPPRRDFTDPAYLLVLIKSGLVGFIYWGGLRLAYYHWCEPRPVARVAPLAPLSTAAAVENSQARSLADLARREGLFDLDEIIAVQAEDHYVRLHTARRSYLVFANFSDALLDLAHLDGSRAHRSHWVRFSAVSRVQRDRRAIFLVLHNGLKMPVSRRHRDVLKRFASTKRTVHEVRFPLA